MIKLIINADDFGLQLGINEAISDLFNREIITSTSAIVCSEFIEDGIAHLSPEFKDRIGLHVCLDEERPISDPTKIFTLVDKKTGHFKNRTKFIQDLFLGKISTKDLYVEIKAQFEKLKRLGIYPDHLDSHGHLHVLPKVNEVISLLLKEYKIRPIRRPIESFLFDFIKLNNIKRIPIARTISLASNFAFSKQFKKNITTELFMGLLDSGHMNSSLWKKCFARIYRIENKTIEIMCHPGKDIVDRSNSRYKHWKYEWQSEYKSLLNVDDYLLPNQNIELISFKDLN